MGSDLQAQNKPEVPELMALEPAKGKEQKGIWWINVQL